MNRSVKRAIFAALSIATGLYLWWLVAEAQDCHRSGKRAVRGLWRPVECVAR